MTFYIRRNKGRVGEVNRRSDGVWLARVRHADSRVEDLGEFPTSLHAIAAVDNLVARLAIKRDREKRHAA